MHSILINSNNEIIKLETRFYCEIVLQDSKEILPVTPDEVVNEDFVQNKILTQYKPQDVLNLHELAKLSRVESTTIRTLSQQEILTLQSITEPKLTTTYIDYDLERKELFIKPNNKYIYDLNGNRYSGAVYLSDFTKYTDVAPIEKGQDDEILFDKELNEWRFVSYGFAALKRNTLSKIDATTVNVRFAHLSISFKVTDFLLNMQKIINESLSLDFTNAVIESTTGQILILSKSPYILLNETLIHFTQNSYNQIFTLKSQTLTAKIKQDLATLDTTILNNITLDIMSIIKSLTQKLQNGSLTQEDYTEYQVARLSEWMAQSQKEEMIAIVG